MRRVGILAAASTIQVLVAIALHAEVLRVKPVVPPEVGSKLHARNPSLHVEVMRPEERAAQAALVKRWRSFPSVLGPAGVDMSSSANRRPGWHPPARTVRPAGTASTRLSTPSTPPDTIHVALLRVEFRTDRGGDKSTGNGRFDLSGPDTTLVPIDRPPHDRRFFQAHMQALSRYFSGQSYGREVIVADVWPRADSAAYNVGDMADFGPWNFTQEVYGRAVTMFRTMFFAADSQSIARGDRIPWNSYDRFVIVHAGSDLQSDVKLDSPEDIPTFTIFLTDTDRVIFPDSTTRPIDRCSMVPELGSQDGYIGAINGAIAHESCINFFGLNDTYDVDTELPEVGLWDVMDSGNLAGARIDRPDGEEFYATGFLPTGIAPWQRQFVTDALAFPEASEVDTMAIADSERWPDVRRVSLSSDEYLLLENRYLAPADSFTVDQDSLTTVILGTKGPDRFEQDALCPGTGLLVWHVDESVIPFVTSLRVNPDYGINTDPERPGMSIIQASGLADLGDPTSPDVEGSPLDPYQLSINPSLSDTTFPNLIPHILTRPHRRLDFLDDASPTMHVRSQRDWQLPNWPIAVDGPPEGPQLLMVDADGDGREDVCWAGGTAAIAYPPFAKLDPDSAALFAVRADGLGLDGTAAGRAFAHLNQRPLPLLAAIPTGAGGRGPSYFAATTYPGAAPSQPGGQVWLLDWHGHALPGWPAALPTTATTPPVIAGSYPNACVVVGGADGNVYALALDGGILASAGTLAGGVSGRLAVTGTVDSPAGLHLTVACGGAEGDVAALDLVAPGPGSGSHAAAWPARISASGFAPDFLWIDFGGASGAAALTPECGAGAPQLVVHFADRLWAFCADGVPIPGWGGSVGDTLLDALGAGDPDGDGFPEVLTQTVASKLAFWNSTGRPSPGWPRPGTTEALRTQSPPLALDVDGDGRSEIVGLNGSGILAALRGDGRTPAGWPLATGAGALGSPAAGDLKGDGSLVVVAPDRFDQLYAYAIPGAAGGGVATPWRMVGGDPGRTSALPASRTPVAPAASRGPLVHGSLVAYPNPARRHVVTFAYQLTQSAQVDVRILDTSGHEVARLGRSGLQSDNVLVWDPGALPAGLYLARFRFSAPGAEATQVVSVGLIR